MSNKPCEARAICPYFLRSTVQANRRAVVVCEGIITGTENLVTFRSKRHMESWMGKCCETYDYGKCPVARIIEEKYGGAMIPPITVRHRCRGGVQITGQITMFELTTMEGEA